MCVSNVCVLGKEEYIYIYIYLFDELRFPVSAITQEKLTRKMSIETSLKATPSRRPRPVQSTASNGRASKLRQSASKEGTVLDPARRERELDPHEEEDVLDPYEEEDVLPLGTYCTSECARI